MLHNLNPITRVLITKISPYNHLFSRDFNFANLEQRYFAGLKFRDFDELPFFKVINFRESSLVLAFWTSISVFYVIITEYKRNKQLAEIFNNVSNI